MEVWSILYDATDSIDDDTNINSAQVIRELIQLGQYNKQLTSANEWFLRHHPTRPWTSKIRKHYTKEKTR